jgi:hypothetical protein
MKNKWLRAFPTVLIFFLILSGCKSNIIKGGKLVVGPAASDIVNYVNQGLLSIAELETRSLKSYASVIGENYTSNQRVYEELKDFVVPTYKRFLDGLRNITPEDEEVRRVHVIYIQAAESMYDGFRTKMIGIEKNDENLIIQGNQKIEKGRIGIERWRSELDALYKKHGVAQIIEK